MVSLIRHLQLIAFLKSKFRATVIYISIVHSRLTPRLNFRNSSVSRHKSREPKFAKRHQLTHGPNLKPIRLCVNIIMSVSCARSISNNGPHFDRKFAFCLPKTRATHDKRERNLKSVEFCPRSAEA